MKKKYWAVRSSKIPIVVGKFTYLKNSVKISLTIFEFIYKYNALKSMLPLLNTIDIRQSLAQPISFEYL